MLLCALLFTSTSCNTGSDVHCQVSPDVTTEIKLLKEELNALRHQMNYEKTARVELDKELTEMTKRYRQLLLEFTGTDLRPQATVGSGNYTDDRYTQLENDVTNNKKIYEELFYEMNQIRELVNLSSNAIHQISENMTNIATSGTEGL